MCCYFGERDRGDGLIRCPDIYEPDITLPASLGFMAWLLSASSTEQHPPCLSDWLEMTTIRGRTPAECSEPDRPNPGLRTAIIKGGGGDVPPSFSLVFWLQYPQRCHHLANFRSPRAKREKDYLHRWCEQCRRIQTSRVSGMLRYANQRAPYHSESFPLQSACTRVASRGVALDRSDYKHIPRACSADCRKQRLSHDGYR